MWNGFFNLVSLDVFNWILGSVTGTKVVHHISNELTKIELKLIEKFVGLAEFNYY